MKMHVALFFYTEGHKKSDFKEFKEKNISQFIATFKKSRILNRS